MSKVKIKKERAAKQPKKPECLPPKPVICPKPFDAPGVGPGFLSLIVEFAKSPDLFISVIARDGFETHVVRPANQTERRRFFDRFENAKVFFLQSFDLGTESSKDMAAVSDQPIKLPSPTCYFAFLPNHMGVFKVEGANFDYHGVGYCSVVALVHEVSPNIFDVYSLDIIASSKGSIDDPAASDDMVLVYRPSVRLDEIVVGRMLTKHLGTLSTSTTELERVNLRIRIGTGDRRRLHVIREINHVTKIAEAI